MRLKGKLTPHYVGPYEILQRVSKVAYELKVPSELALVHMIFQVSMLKKFIDYPESILPIRVLVSRITSLMRNLLSKFLIGKS